MRQWLPFAWPLAVLAALPLWRAVGWLTPLGPLSELTAWLSRQWLELCGFSASQQVLFLYLPGGGVKVAGACTGVNILLQLVVVALLFAKAFPMRHRWQNGLMLLIAPVLAVLINTMRIAMLAWIHASGLPHKQWCFEFLHDSWGGLVFARVAMQLLFGCMWFGWRGSWLPLALDELLLFAIDRGRREARGPAPAALAAWFGPARAGRHG